MLRKILVPVRDNLPFELQMSYARALSTRFKSHVEVAHCHPKPEDFLPHGLSVPKFLRDKLLTQAEEYATYQESDLKESFRSFFGDMAEADDGPGLKAPGASWREYQGKPGDVVKERGRLADLIIVPKPAHDTNIGSNALVSSIYDTGRPVLMCPPEAPEPGEKVAGKVCIAWNGSLNISRGVALTLDILERADTVTILVAGQEETHGASSEDLAQYLAIRGIKAETDRFEPTGRIAEALMERQEALGSDLMIMGAYSVSHEREAIFGGNTQRIVDNATRPVIFVH